MPNLLHENLTTLFEILFVMKTTSLKYLSLLNKAGRREKALQVYKDLYARGILSNKDILTTFLATNT